MPWMRRRLSWRCASRRASLSCSALSCLSSLSCLSLSSFFCLSSVLRFSVSFSASFSASLSAFALSSATCFLRLVSTSASRSNSRLTFSARALSMAISASRWACRSSTLGAGGSGLGSGLGTGLGSAAGGGGSSTSFGAAACGTADHSSASKVGKALVRQCTPELSARTSSTWAAMAKTKPRPMPGASGGRSGSRAWPGPLPKDAADISSPPPRCCARPGRRAVCPPSAARPSP